MIQEQLVQYIKAQFAAGVSREKLVGALKEAGWPMTDIDDSLRAAETTQGPAAPAVGSPTVAKTGQPTVSVSDFYGESTLKGAVSPANLGARIHIKSATSETAVSKTAVAATAGKSEGGKPHSALKTVFIILLAALIVGSVGESAYFFLRMRALQGSLETSKAESEKVLAQLNNIKNEAERVPSLQGRIAELEKQVADVALERDGLRQASTALEATSTALVAEAERLLGLNALLNEEKERLTGDVQRLTSELTYLVLPRGTSTSTPATVTLSGTLAVDSKGVYTLTTPTGLRATVKNSKDAKVIAALSPLVKQTAELGGTHASLAKEITVKSVNGVEL